MGGIGSGPKPGDTRRCGKCGQPGHRRTTCGRADARAAKASEVYAPAPVAVGDVFLVVEDFEEDDERNGGPWRADQLVVAVEKTGEVDGFEEWRLRSDDFPRLGDWFESVGFPQLYPFQRRPRSGSLDVPRVGMGTGALSPLVTEAVVGAPLRWNQSWAPCLVRARFGRACRSCDPDEPESFQAPIVAAL